MKQNKQRSKTQYICIKNSKHTITNIYIYIHRQAKLKQANQQTTMASANNNETKQATSKNLAN